MKVHNTLYDDYLYEIEKLQQIAKLQHEKEIIELDEYNDILFALYDKIGDYKRNIGKIKLPNVEIKNYRSINVLSIIDSLFGIG